MVNLNILAGAALLFVLLTAQALFFLSRCRLRFELGIPISLMLDMLILLFSGLFASNLLLGVELITVFSMAGLMVALLGERKHLREFFSVFSSLGFIVFAVGFVFCWLVSIRHVAYDWDDYGHWLPFVKQMVNYDMLYSESGIYLIRHWYYTPGMALLEYFGCKLCGGYSAGICFSVSTLTLFICVLPLVKWLRFKTKSGTIFAVIAVFLSVFVTAHEDLNGYFIGFGTAYVDIHLSVICTLLLLWGYYEEDSTEKVISMGIIATALAMIKVTGIMFALLGVGTYVISYLTEWVFKKIRGQQVSCNVKSITANVLALFAPIVVYALWSIVSSSDQEYSSVIGIGLSGVVHSVKKYDLGLTVREVQLTASWLREYFYHFFTTILNMESIMPLTASPFVLAFLFLIVVKCALQKEPLEKKIRTIVLGVCMVGGMILYLLAIGITFYSLNENLSSMTSYQRYLSSYVEIFILLTTVFAIQIFAIDLALPGKKNAVVYATLLLILVMILPADILPAMFGTNYSTDGSHENKKEYYRMEAWGKKVVETVYGKCESNPKVFLYMDYNSFPDTPSLNGEVAVMSYFTLPVEMQDFSQFGYDPDMGLPFEEEEEWGSVLLNNEFSYVMVSNFSSDSMIWWEPSHTNNLSKMYDLFDLPPEELTVDRPLLFEVNKDNEGQAELRLILVEWPIA